MSEPPLPGPGAALFLDFDGTLVEIAPNPDAVQVPPGLTALLAKMSMALGGALALVSGRSLADLDALLGPLCLPAAGVHGVERRCADGRLLRLEAPALAPVTPALQRLCDLHPGLRLDTKPGALALHYRQAPDLEALCLQAMEQAGIALPGMALLHGKMVVELKPQAAGKGRAVQAFLSEPPFAGRRPWFVGDDVTDEHGFEAVQALGGVAVKVGTGPSLAPHRLTGPEAVLQWLDRSAASLRAAAPG